MFFSTCQNGIDSYIYMYVAIYVIALDIVGSCTLCQLVRVALGDTSYINANPHLYQSEVASWK